MLRGARPARPYMYYFQLILRFAGCVVVAFYTYFKARGATRPAWLAGWLPGWPVGWLAARLLGWLAGCLAGWLVGWPAAWLFAWLAGCLEGWVAGRKKWERRKKEAKEHQHLHPYIEKLP